MRRLDRWLGIPLCFAATWALRIAQWLRIEPQPQSVLPARRVLFLELSEMGSTVIASPAMHEVQNKLNTTLFFTIFARNVESILLLQMIPTANIFVIRDDNLLTLALDSLRFLHWTRRNKIDAILDLELFSRYSALLTGLSGARIRIGFHRFHAEGLYRGSMLTHPVVYNGHTHMAKNFLAMAHALSADRRESPYAKTVIPDDRTRVATVPIHPSETDAAHELVRQVFDDYDPRRHRIVLLNPNSSEMLPQRRWPREHFMQLANRIVSEWNDVLVAITGSAAERNESLWMEAEIGHRRVRSLAGMHSLRMLLAIYTISDALVTNDSGPAHFSALTNIPSIVLFGPETPTLYGSLGNTESLTLGLACSPCVTAANQKNSACTDPVCMRMLHPEFVLQSVRRALDSQADNTTLASGRSATGAPNRTALTAQAVRAPLH
jgi:ADP-heptose:LPS heptosyltransferase